MRRPIFIQTLISIKVVLLLLTLAKRVARREGSIKLD